MSIGQAAVDTERLAAFKASGVVDDDTIVYLPLDDDEPAHDKALDNYAYGSKTKEATLNINKGIVASETGSIPGDGGKIRGGYLAQCEAEDYGCLHFRKNGTDQCSGSILIADADSSSTIGSFTFEAFMRWRTLPTGGTFMFAKHAKAGYVQIYMGTGGKLELLVGKATWNEEAQTVTDWVEPRPAPSSGNLVDDRWHYVAVTVDRDQDKTTLYVDYTPVGTIDFAPPLELPHGGYNQNLMVGTGYYPTSAFQMNDGYIDNVRLTGRVLDRSEFLCVEKIVDVDPDLLAWISFEDGQLGIWPYPWARSPSTLAGTASVSDETAGGDALKVEGEIVRMSNTNSLGVASDTRIYWNDRYFCGKSWDSLTIEFFAKGTACRKYGEFLTLKGTSAVRPDIVDTGIAGVSGAYDGLNYKLFIDRTTSDLAQNQGYTISNSESSHVATDGVWHHVAAVFKKDGNFVRMTGYYDYQEIVTGLTATYQANSLLDNLTEATLRLGPAIDGNVDEIRIMKRALEPSEFLRRKYFGLAITIR